MAFNLFNKNKKEEEKLSYDPLNISVFDLQAGFVFEYDLREWLVEEAYDYDWGSEHFTREYKVTDGTETYFLSVDGGDETEIALFKKIRLGEINEDIAGTIQKEEMPPQTITFNNITFYRENETPGFFKDDGDESVWEELISWDYYDEKEAFVIEIEQWGERKYEAAFGKVLLEREISNILAGKIE